jgi:hypothetical protein
MREVFLVSSGLCDTGSPSELSQLVAGRLCTHMEGK